MNWGLGHASRCIPIIQHLLGSNQIVLASDGLALKLLRKEFPDLPFTTLPAYDIHYKGSSFIRSIMGQSPKIARSISEEMALADELVEKYGIDMIISDHRLGFRSEYCKSIILAHQIQIQGVSGPLGVIGKRINKYFINLFDECWIPDYEIRSLSLAGDLSLSKGIKKYKYIGPLTRLRRSHAPPSLDILLLLSGPEPSRSRFEKKVLDLLSTTKFSVRVVRGTSDLSRRPEGLTQYLSLTNTEELQEILNKCKIVISRCGYSTIMDMTHLQKKAILIPTSGQTEQEYLAAFLKGRDQFRFMTEDQLSQALLPALNQLLN